MNVRIISTVLLWVTVACCLMRGVACPAADVKEQSPVIESFPLLTNISQLQNFARGASNRVCSFRLTGVVCAVDQENGRLVLKDASDIEVLHVELSTNRGLADVAAPLTPALSPSDGERGKIKKGDRIVMEGTGYTVGVSEMGLWLGTGPVVNNDGLHPLDEKSGATYLTAGLQPIRIRWFNHLASTV